MKTPADALTVRARIHQAFEAAEASADPQERAHWLTFALVGGGPTGVVLAGQIREIAGHTLDREFSTVDPGRARVLLFDGSGGVLGAFGPVLSRRAARTLDALGVEVHLQSVVTQVDDRGLTVRRKDSGTDRVEARTVPRTAGARHHRWRRLWPGRPAPSRTERGASASNPISPSPATRRSGWSAT
ncbi:FAD-dependent oxidoreductase [Streptomyces sp. CB03911]|uniref:FAD-dependent oxidoreductase n=1 Tax=Streptomyces sp. CB03911 TaxID=1804758 RepID=UPI00257126D7|nr:FAD-dependent oxidoreductase [Streptomyces sp. CB03911]